MIKIRLTSFFVLLGLSLNAQNLGDLSFGTDSTLELITWNIENFPKKGVTTVNYVANIIEKLDVDLVAIQEIEGTGRFGQLVQKLDGWDGFYVDAEYSALGFIYKTDVIEVLDSFEIFTTRNREFPRPPLVIEIKYNDEMYVVINNHLKCCGDGDLESGNVWDEETRRYHASILLEAYVNSVYPNENVIVLGDLNDLIDDAAPDNVFKAFIDAPDQYVFADMEIAQGESSNWSFPQWPSHLDHILVTDELFLSLGKDASEVMTIKIDDYLDGGFDEYDENVSNHRPVALKLDVRSDVVSAGDLVDDRVKLIAYPNPFRQSTTIAFDHNFSNAEIDIYSASGEKVQSYISNPGEYSVTWDANGLPSGIYYIAMTVGSELKSIAKVILAD